MSKRIAALLLCFVLTAAFVPLCVRAEGEINLASGLPYTVMTGEPVTGSYGRFTENGVEFDVNKGQLTDSTTALLSEALLNGNGFACLPMATGGAGNLTAERMRPLRGRDVIIFPDNGMFAGWYDKALAACGCCRSVRISTICEAGHIGHTADGCDLGDYLAAHADDIDKTLIDLHIAASLFDVA